MLKFVESRVVLNKDVMIWMKISELAYKEIQAAPNLRSLFITFIIILP